MFTFVFHLALMRRKKKFYFSCDHNFDLITIKQKHPFGKMKVSYVCMRCVRIIVVSSSLNIKYQKREKSELSEMKERIRQRAKNGFEKTAYILSDNKYNTN